MPLARIYLIYGTESYLLPYRSFYGAAPATVIFSRPDYSCERDSLTRMQAALARDGNAQLIAMMAAGNLLQRPPRQCPRSSKARLIDLYFRLNCQLSISKTFVAYLDEAERQFRRRWAGNVQRAQFAQRCRLGALSTFRSAAANFRNGVASQIAQHVSNRSYSEAMALARTVQALQRDPELGDVFREFALTDLDIDSWNISRLLQEQVEAQQAGDEVRASTPSRQLVRLASDPAQHPAFDRAQIRLDRIRNDARLIATALRREAWTTEAMAAPASSER